MAWVSSRCTTFRLKLRRKISQWPGLGVNFGVRKLEFRNDTDSIGNRFYFKLNNQPVFIKGANLLPIDLLTRRITGKRIETLLNNIAAANLNMVRIPSDGVVVSDTFYELCDKKGIMVWQDLPSPLPEYKGVDVNHFEEEVPEIVKKLRNHPCIALFYGAELKSPKNGRKKEKTPLFSAVDGLYPSAVSRFAPHISYYSATSNRENTEWQVWGQFSTYNDLSGSTKCFCNGVRNAIFSGNCHA